MNNIQLYNADNLEVMATLADESIDVICIDPPYLYINKLDWDRPFDETKFFTECKRLLTKKGFIVMFGRGTSFYRWNTILDELGFVFKEEVIWDKGRTSSPALPIGRRHETIAIFTKKNGVINNCKVPYIERKMHNLDSLVSDIKVIRNAIKSSNKLDKIERFLQGDTSVIYSEGVGKKKWNINVDNHLLRKTDDLLFRIKIIEQGVVEESVMPISRGSLINNIHPTQKPVRLLERLLALVIPKDKPRNEIVVADFFAGSMSCMEAVHNMGMRGIATEIDEEYFEKGKQRIESLQPLIINH